MQKFSIAFYQKSNSMWSTNGGTFIITENEYIIKYLFQTVARFEIQKTLVSKINPLFLKGINLNDGKKGIDIYFYSKTTEKICCLLNLK